MGCLNRMRCVRTPIGVHGSPAAPLALAGSPGGGSVVVQNHPTPSNEKLRALRLRARSSHFAVAPYG